MLQRNEIMALPSAQKVKTELHTFLLEGNKDITRSSWKQVYSACLWWQADNSVFF